MLCVVKRRCVGCGLCVDLCPADAILLEADMARIDNDRCRMCQACIRNCPQRAIRVMEDSGVVVAFGTEDGNILQRGHIGQSKSFVIYKFFPDQVISLGKRDNVKYQEDETKIGGDPGKAKATAKVLAGIDVIVGRRFGPNIAKMRNMFVCVVVREKYLEQAIDVVRENICDIMEQQSQEDKYGLVLN